MLEATSFVRKKVNLLRDVRRMKVKKVINISDPPKNILIRCLVVLHIRVV